MNRILDRPEGAWISVTRRRNIPVWIRRRF